VKINIKYNELSNVRQTGVTVANTSVLVYSTPDTRYVVCTLPYNMWDKVLL
jgi:hypothetical protein